MAPKVHGQIY